jgi:hypothetical protein
MKFATAFRVSPLLLVLTAWPTAAQEPRLIVPGERVGLVTAKTSEAELIAQLPAGQVRRVLYSLGEGAAGCGTEIFSGTDDVVVIGWWGDNVEYELDNAADLAECQSRQDFVRPGKVMIESSAGSWHTDSGIRLGMTLSDLARLGDEPISVSVCPCDFGGFIQASDEQVPDGLELWADFPLNADYTYANVIDTAADYMLSSRDIGASAESDFIISRMIVVVGR